MLSDSTQESPIVTKSLQWSCHHSRDLCRGEEAQLVCCGVFSSQSRLVSCKSSWALQLVCYGGALLKRPCLLWRGIEEKTLSIMTRHYRKHLFCYGEASVIDPSSLLWLGIVGLTTTLSWRAIEKTSQLMCCDGFISTTCASWLVYFFI